jgi:hypothetical protein
VAIKAVPGVLPRASAPVIRSVGARLVRWDQHCAHRSPIAKHLAVGEIGIGRSLATWRGERRQLAPRSERGQPARESWRRTDLGSAKRATSGWASGPHWRARCRTGGQAARAPGGNPSDDSFVTTVFGLGHNPGNQGQLAGRLPARRMKP